MKPEEKLREVVRELEERGISFALAGGLAARVYRTDLRETKDIDIAIDADNAEERAREIVRNLGLKPTVARRADLAGGPLFAIKSRSTPVEIVSGENTLDILLPELAWVPSAVERAQRNLYDFGFGPVPVLCPEDLILAKLLSLANRSTREKDKDDLRVLLVRELDLSYLAKEMKRLRLSIPEELEKFSAPPLLEVSRDVIKETRHLGRER